MTQAGGWRLEARGWIVAFLVTGCSTGEPRLDAGADADTLESDGDVDGFDELLLELPEPPSFLQWEPCPEGWYPSVLDGRGEGVICDPLPEEGLLMCPPGQAHFLGDEVCRRVGPPCPSLWPTDIDGEEGQLWYVNVETTGTGIGSEDDPFLRIEQALESASSGDTVVIAAGVYRETLTIRSSLSIIGACPAETIIRADLSTDRPAISVESPDVHIKNIGIEGGRGGIFVGRGMSATVENLFIIDVEGSSIEVLGSLSGREVVAIGHIDPPLDVEAWGILVDGGGEVELSGSVIRGHWDGQVIADSESSTHLVDTIAGVRIESDEYFGGMGVVATNGSQVSLERVVLDANLIAGLFVSGEGTLLDIERGLILFTDAEDSIGTGGGIEVTAGGEVKARWVYIYESQGPGIWVDEEAKLQAEDIAISGNRGLDGDGFGLSIHTGAQVELERVFIIDVEEVAIAITDEDTHCSLEDVRVRVVEPSWDDMFFGAGLYAGDRAHVEGSRIDIMSLWAVGVIAEDHAILELEDLVVSEVYPDFIGGWGGHALYAGGASTVTIERLDVERAANIGLMLFDTETNVTLRHAAIHDTTSFCPGCSEQLGGISVGVYDGAHLEMESFAVTNSALCAIQIAHGGIDENTPNELHGEVDLRMGLIASNPIGINIQAEDYDLDRLMEGVLFHENERNIDAETIPIPPVPDLMSEM